MTEEKSPKIESPKKSQVANSSKNAQSKEELKQKVNSKAEESGDDLEKESSRGFSGKVWQVTKVIALAVLILLVLQALGAGSFWKAGMLVLAIVTVVWTFFSLDFWDEIAKVAFWAFLIVVPIRVFFFQPFFVQGASMEPNFHDGEYLIIKEWGYKKTQVALGDWELFTVNPFRELERGDVAVFRYPNNPDKFFIKRVIGLPGEKVIIDEDGVKVFNSSHPRGFLLEEGEYLAPNLSTDDFETFDLGKEEYVVLGDNRPHSSDSRAWGTLKKEFVIGKVWLRAWPLEEFEFFSREDSPEKPLLKPDQKKLESPSSIQLSPMEPKKK